MRFIYLSLMLALSMAFCVAKPLTIVVTTTLIQDWVANIAQEKAIITPLIPRGSDAHTFSLTPQDIILLEKADIIFAHGLGFEPWLQPLSKNLKTRCIALSEHIPLDKLLKTHTCCHHHQDYDPHTWLNIENVIIMVDTIQKELKTIDPSNQKFYTSNSLVYIETLKNLELRTIEKLKSIPENKRVLITEHNNMGYFAKKYDFKIAGTILNSASTDEQDPSANTLVKIIKIIQNQKIPAIFKEASSNNPLPDQISKITHLPEPYILFTESVGPAPADNYYSMMEHNVDTILKALK